LSPRVCRRSTAVVALILFAATPTTARRGDSELAIERARHQFDGGRYAEAVDTLTATIVQEPQDSAAYFWLGRAQFELRDYTSAIKSLERSVELSPADSEFHRWLGRFYGQEAGRKRSLSLAARVRRQFEDAVRVSPTNLAARRDLMQFYLEAPWILGGSDAKARQQVHEIAALDPTAGHLARAAFLTHQNDRAQAAAEYQVVLDARPENVDWYFEVAEFYEKGRDVPGLRATLEGAASADPLDPRLLYFRGIVDVVAGVDFSDAESLLQEYLSVPVRSDRPSRASTHEWLGRLYEQLGKPARAVVEYRAALALEPERKSAQESLRRLTRT